MREKVSNIFKLILPILLVGALQGWINTNMLLVVFVLYLMFLTRDGVSIASVFILAPVLGLLKGLFNIPLPGSVMAFLLILVLQRENISHFVVKTDRPALFYVMLIIFILTGFYFIAGYSENGQDKFGSMLISSVVYITGLLILTKSTKETVDMLSPLFLLYGIILLRFPLDFYGYPSPDGLFDFTFFRDATIANKQLELPYLTYHLVGIAGVMSTAYFLSGRDSIGGIQNYVLLLTCFWLILLSGTRQSIVGFIIVFACWQMLKGGEIKILNLLGVVLFVYLAYMLLEMLDVEYIQKMFDTSSDAEERLNRNYDYPLQVIEDYPFTGIGFGHYFNPMTYEIYPHNIILEILCELGAFGMVVLLIPTLVMAIAMRVSFSTQLQNGYKVLLLWIPYVVRSLISGDLGENIVVFISFAIFFFNPPSLEVEDLDEDGDDVICNV